MKVNRTELATALGVSMPTIDRYIRDGCPVEQHGGRGREWIFNLPDVIKWDQNRKIADAAGSAPSDLAEIEKRTATARMMAAELDLAKKRGDVAPIRDFERAQARAFAEIRANVMNVPQRVVISLLGETDETRFKDVMRKELALALEAAANADLVAAEDEPEGAGA